MIKLSLKNPWFLFSTLIKFMSVFLNCQKNLEIILFTSPTKLISVLWSILRLQINIQGLGNILVILFLFVPHVGIHEL